MPQKDSAEKAVRDIRRKTRRKFSAEEKIRIVLEGLRGEESIASLCRREGIAANLYYRWSKEFLEAGKKRLLGDTQREATSNEVTGRDGTRESSAQKKRAGLRFARGRGVRVSAAEKLELIRLVEGSQF
jgi:transposase